MSDQPTFKRVILESPYAGETPEILQRNIDYARRAVSDSLHRGEAPIASHLLYTQPGVLRDQEPEERELGIAAGLAWAVAAEASVVYCDHGISAGMQLGIDHAIENRRKIEYRYLDKQVEEDLRVLARNRGRC